MRSKLFLVVMVVAMSCLQAMVITYTLVGAQAVGIEGHQQSSTTVPSAVILNYLHQLDTPKISEIIGWFFTRTVTFFLIQSVPLVVYFYCSHSTRQKRIIALTTWLLPAIISAPTIIVPILYIFSPLISIEFFSNLLSDQLAERDFRFGLTPTSAAIGLFNLFWFSMIIKSWFFPDRGSRT
jgi:hypothetical protein